MEGNWRLIPRPKGRHPVHHQENGKTVSIVQNIDKDDVPLHIDQRVMIETPANTRGYWERTERGARNGQYQRVLPADDNQ